MMMEGMYWQWIRWQCLNQVDWNFGEIPKGTMIDQDQFIIQILKQLRPCIQEARRLSAKQLDSGSDSHRGLQNK